MNEIEKAIENLNTAKLILCNQQMLTPEMCIRIGQAITDSLALLKEREAKQPVHDHKEFQEHDWYRDEDGEIDDFAFEAGYHNGPMCKRCAYAFCKHCEPDGWNKKPCVIDNYKCPRCGRHIIRGTKFCSDCGQAVTWE